jgi:hypothetical protein
MIDTELWLIVAKYCLFDDSSFEDVEWLLTASVDMDYKTAEMLILDHISEITETNKEDIQLDDVYYNKYTEVDGFDINLTEKDK